ncbi:MAG TPA: thioredoxin [Kiritimatiellia bacterium]|mgnify:CR=1 FL=1|jgi:thioredoxin 1|nr:thioredoxin [Kiritimatiellia bacterium]HNR95169.1 thioredoxin [Kiritimatiellia bacterium]HNS80013.1 thioredoxin [Kiritimatiellia bacterium]HPA77983.1 thioredoxin [Kiritimatiellia bacterium]HQQ03852.1 thioredoxin [Kiritimatiellia bacterium]
MSEKVKEIGKGQFEETIKTGVVLVDFWAPWCGPCRMQGPILETVAEKVAGKAQIAKVNVDDLPEVAGQFGVRSIPTLIIFKNGQAAKTFVGVQQDAKLVSEIEALV